MTILRRAPLVRRRALKDAALHSRVRGVAALGAGILLGVVLTGSTARAAEDWEMKCEGGLCTLARTLVDAPSGRRVATVFILLGPDIEAEGRAGQLSIALPLGVALAPGVQAVGGGQTFELSFDVCYPDGCRASALLDHLALETFVSLPEIEVRAFPFGAERPVSVTVPLDGLPEALASAQDALPRR